MTKVLFSREHFGIEFTTEAIGLGIAVDRFLGDEENGTLVTIRLFCIAIMWAIRGR